MQETKITYDIKYYEMCENKALKPNSFLLLLQDIATQNAEKIGFGASFMFRHNYAWFLLKYRIEMKKWPMDFEKITVKTKPRGFQKIYAFRDFFIYNGDVEIGRVASCWTLVDLNNKKPLNLANVKEYNLPYEKSETDLQFNKIAKPDKIDLEKEFEILYDEIDVNHHANNTNYITWALAPISKDFRASHLPKNIDMLFKHEISYGGKLVSEVEMSKNETLHLLKNKETKEDLCQIKIEWEEIKPR